MGTWREGTTLRTRHRGLYAFDCLARHLLCDAGAGPPRTVASGGPARAHRSIRPAAERLLRCRERSVWKESVARIGRADSREDSRAVRHAIAGARRPAGITPRGGRVLRSPLPPRKAQDGARRRRRLRQRRGRGLAARGRARRRGGNRSPHRAARPAAPSRAALRRPASARLPRRRQVVPEEAVADTPLTSTTAHVEPPRCRRHGGRGLSRVPARRRERQRSDTLISNQVVLPRGSRSTPQRSESLSTRKSPRPLVSSS